MNPDKVPKSLHVLVLDDMPTLYIIEYQSPRSWELVDLDVMRKYLNGGNMNQYEASEFEPFCIWDEIYMKPIEMSDVLNYLKLGKDTEYQYNKGVFYQNDDLILEQDPEPFMEYIERVSESME